MPHTSPRSFNPLHEGHLQLADVAATITGRPVRCLSPCLPVKIPATSTHPPDNILYRPRFHQVAMELAVCNADKGTIAADEVRRRLQQFTPARGRDLVRMNPPTLSPVGRLVL